MKNLLSTALIVSLFCTSAFPAKMNKKAKRKISSEDLIGKISDKDKTITDKLNKIVTSVKPAKHPDGSPNYEVTAQTVGKAIKDIKKIAKDNPNSDIAQLYKAAAEHIPHFKGFVYRLRQVVEVSDVAYLSAIWALKQAKQTSSFRAPYMEALFDLATMPNPNEEILNQKGMFKSVGELQDWLVKQIIPKFEVTIDTMRKIAYKTGDGVHPIGMIDAELLVGDVIAKRYVPAKHAHKEWILTSGHLIGLVSALENYMGFMYYLSSYNLEKLAELSNILTVETFKELKGPTSRSEIFASLSKRVDLLSSKRVYELTSSNVNRKSKSGLFGPKSRGGKKDYKERFSADYRAFGTLRSVAKSPVKSEVGGTFDNYLKASQFYFTRAAEDQLEYHNAMVATYGASGEDKLVINPTTYKATLDLTPYIDQGKILEKAIEAIKTDGPVNFKDHFIDKDYTVDTSVLFDVNKVNDLRKFLPNKFNDSRTERNPEEPIGINWRSSNIERWKNTYSWNYSYNKATQWKDPTFGGLLPNITKDSKNDEMALHLMNVGSLPEIPYVALWLAMFYGY